MNDRLERNPATICSVCSAPGTRQIGYDRYCDPCAETVLAPIRARVLARQGHVDVIRPPDPFGGHGVQSGPLRPDYGPGWMHLECDRCSAGWVGREGEPCDWCARQHELLLDAQRDVLLHPDLPEPDDTRRLLAVDAWAGRLGRAVAAGVLNEPEARRALDRELERTPR